jgi:hypothetical protein
VGEVSTSNPSISNPNSPITTNNKAASAGTKLKQQVISKKSWFSVYLNHDLRTFLYSPNLEIKIHNEGLVQLFQPLDVFEGGEEDVGRGHPSRRSNASGEKDCEDEKGGNAPESGFLETLKKSSADSNKRSNTKRAIPSFEVMLQFSDYDEAHKFVDELKLGMGPSWSQNSLDHL